MSLDVYVCVCIFAENGGRARRGVGVRRSRRDDKGEGKI